MRLVTLVLFGLAAVIATPSPADAGKKAGVTMPDTIVVAGKRLALNGMGLREATWLKIDVYVAGLYVEHASSDPATLINSNEVKRLVLRFVRDVDRGDIVKAWNAGFKNNAPTKLNTLRPLIDRLNAWMGDFDDGDTLTFTYVPEVGVQVDVGSARKGVIKSDDFARALLAVWLGPKPPNGGLKKGLLGKH